MDVNMSTSTALAQSTTSTEVGMAVLKKSIDIEAQGSMALINAIPQPQSSANLPPHLGQNINVTA